MTTNAFSDTFDLLKNYIEYKKPYTYSEWLELPLENKCAALFVQFYKQVCLSWKKASRSCIGKQLADSEDGASAVLLILMKNVEIIENEESRFTEAYIYRICYNAILDECKSKNNRRRFTEIAESQITTVNEEDTEFSVFDRASVSYDYVRYINYNDVWHSVESYSGYEKEIADALMFGKEKLPKRLTGTKKFKRAISKLKSDLSDYVYEP